MFLKVLQGLFIACGLGLLLALPFIAHEQIDNTAKASPHSVSWTCQSFGSGGNSRCTMSGEFVGEGSNIRDVTVMISIGMFGLGLIGAAIALGAFQPPPEAGYDAEVVQNAGGWMPPPGQMMGPPQPMPAPGPPQPTSPSGTRLMGWGQQQAGPPHPPPPPGWTPDR